jgi:nitrate/nitrite transporter NarK
MTAAQLGILHSSFFYIYAVMQIPTGILADRIGPRYVGSIGATVLSVGAIGFAISDSYWMAFLCRLFLGIGGGSIFISILRFCANWFRPTEFATMTGITGAIGGLGGIIATTPLALTVERVGWRITVLGLAGVGFVGAVAVFAFTRRSPRVAGLEPINGVQKPPSVTLAETVSHLRDLACDLDQWLVSIMFCAALGTILTLLGLWGVPFLVAVYGLDVTTASYFTLLGSIGMFIGPPLIGWFSDRLGRRILLMTVGLGLFTAALGIIPLLGQPPLFAVAGSYFFSGFFVGAAMLGFSVVKERYPPQASGVATATVNTAGLSGSAVLPTLMGMALDAYRAGKVIDGTAVYTEFGYRIAFSIVSAAVAIGFLCSAWLLVRDKKNES